MKKIFTFLIVATAAWTGGLDAQSYNSMTQRIGNFLYTNGDIGSRSCSSTTERIGNYVYTNGRIDPY